MKPTYPTLTDAQLVPFRAIEAQFTEFPDILDRQDCPYPPYVKTMLRRLLLGQAVASAGPAYSDDEQLREITSLYEEIKKAGFNTQTTDPKDKMAMLKTSADLLTKMTTLREKQVNVRDMSRFKSVVVEILETVIDPGQRQEFIEKLGKYA